MGVERVLDDDAAIAAAIADLHERAGGRIAKWIEDAFVRRFRYAVATASPMPWATFARMTDDDLRAIYRYLATLPAAH